MVASALVAYPFFALLAGGLLLLGHRAEPVLQILLADGLPAERWAMGGSRRNRLAVLVRTGGPASAGPRGRMAGISATWGRDLEVLGGLLVPLEKDPRCVKRWGDNHWRGLSCMEARAQVGLMNRTDFDWLLVVDDDHYVFIERLIKYLLTLNPLKPRAFGLPYCGNCAPKGQKQLLGFCGGGGYVLSRESLLHMAKATAAPVPAAVGEAFVGEFMQDPMMEWCDVRFGCVARNHGLAFEGMPGLFGNGFKDDKEERDILEGRSKRTAPTVVHNIKNSTHMRSIYLMASRVAAEKEQKQLSEQQQGPKRLLRGH